MSAPLVLRDIYGAFMRNGLRLFEMDIRSAEMTKYTANCMLATKISFINEIANLMRTPRSRCRTGATRCWRRQSHRHEIPASWGWLRRLMLPKDVRALIRTALDAGRSTRIAASGPTHQRAAKNRMFGKIPAWADLTNRTSTAYGWRVGVRV